MCAIVETVPVPPDGFGTISICRNAKAFQGRPCLFLDRDGVIVEDVGYLGRVEDVILLDGVSETIAAANAAEIPVVVVTNQAGIGRGYYSWGNFLDVQTEIEERLRTRGAALDWVFACAYHAEGLGRYAVPDHSWRKPRPGMFLEAARVLAIDMKRSLVVGDKPSDLEAGREAGLGSGLLVSCPERVAADGVLPGAPFHLDAVSRKKLCSAVQNWLSTLET